MITQIKLDSFTVFNIASELKFTQKINVLAGENGSGKTHLIKLAYTLAFISYKYKQSLKNSAINKEEFQKIIATKLVNVFKPESLGRLVNRRQGRKKCVITCIFSDQACNFEFSFSNLSSVNVDVTLMPTNGLENPPIFIPTKEILSFYQGFTSLYSNKEIGFDETYYDLCLSLDAPLLKGPRMSDVNNLVEDLETTIGGKIRVNFGKFYLKQKDKGEMEISLVAEGLRKLLMVIYLILNGALSEKSVIFWDEPETNLNPKLLKIVAELIYKLSGHKIQVFITTHSLFLLRELDILSYKNKDIKFISLTRQQDLNISFSNSLEDLESLMSLDEALLQTDRYIKLEN
jgi:AAA15 family ATPase/GTPase